MTPESLIEAFNEPVVIVTKEALVLYANRAAKLTFALKANMSLKPYVHDEALYFALKNEEIMANSRIIELKLHASLSRQFILALSPLEAGLRLLHFKDISNERQLNKIRADFIANASHELRTPLAALSGFIETLRTSAQDDKAAQRLFLPLMQDQATRMAHLIDDLLSLSRVELREHLPPQHKISLYVVLSKTRDMLSLRASKFEMQIELIKECEDDCILGEREELERLFENLIENAFKYAREGKKINLTLMQSEYNMQKSVSVCVKDYGQGVREEHLPRLTERFYRVEPNKKESTGLGLALVKHIVTHHRGRLTFKSPPHSGLEVWVTFPLAEG